MKLYRTAVITDEISQDLEAAAEVAAAYGLAGLEIRSVAGRNPFEMDRRDMRRVKELADDRGLSICCVAAPLFKCGLEDEAAYRAHLDGAARCMEAARLWGAPILRGFTFWNRDRGEADFEEIARRYEPVLRMAEQAGVRVALESEPSVATRNMELLARFLERLDSPWAGALYDPGNEICDQSAAPPYPDGYERLRGRVIHIHVKDMRRGFLPAMLGEGEVDFHGLFRRLKKDGYGGWVSVETHYRPGAKLDDALLTRPQGAAFSEGGREATEAYLTVLRDKYHWMEEE